MRDRIQTAEMMMTKDKRDWIKLELRLPTTYSYRQQASYNEFFKAALKWDISTRQPKEHSAEYKMRKDPSVLIHELISKQQQ